MSKKAPNSPNASDQYRCPSGFPSAPKTLALAIAACWLGSIIQPALAQLPTGATVVHGSASIASNGNAITVINSPGAIVNWQTFSIGQPNAVNFQQQSAASQVLNRVTGNNPSQILGSLSSNGKVWLINPYGILFGQNARIDVAGLVASTLNVSDADFLANRYKFAGVGAGSLVNQGRITTPFGGNVYLVGATTRNEGLIQAPGGEIVLAAGQSVELVDSGMPNLIVRITAPAGDAVNVGSLIAEGGRIDVHAATVNQSGIIRADAVQTDSAGRIVLTATQTVTLGEASETSAVGGNVHLEANSVNNRGSISGQDISIAANDILQQGRVIAPGGRITMTAGRSTYLDGSVDVSNPFGNAGSIWLTTGKLEGMAGGSLRADGLEGGQIHVEGSGMVAFSSTFSATGAKHGGSVEVTGDSVYLLNADIDASGRTQGGTIHLGGGWQGSGSLPHAREVFIGVGSEVRANGPLGDAAVAGRGGELVVWSTESSENYGSLRTLNGGRIEFSSTGTIRPGDLQAGPGGSVLFDPKNIIITDNPPDSIALARKVTSGSVTSAQPALVDGDFLGSAVALDGDRLAVGASGDNTGGFQTGAVHLFTGVGSNFSGLTWRKKLASGTGAFGMPALTADDYFGTSIALRGDFLAVGAPFDDTGGTDRGAVHLFTGVGADFSGLTWNKKLASGIGAVNMPALVNADDFGRAVALDIDANGYRLAVGASVDDSGGAGRGAVHLFTGSGTDFSGLTWVKKLASSTGASGMPALTNLDEFGYALALREDTLAVGAPLDDPGGTDRGAVYLFRGVGTDFSGLTWQNKFASGTGADSMPTLANNDHFGSSIALDGNRLAVGAPAEVAGATGNGAVYLLNGLGDNIFAWRKTLASGTGAANMPALTNGDAFGWSVALDGDLMAIGARQDSTGGVSRGAVHLFTGVGADFSGLTWQKKIASGTGTTATPVLSDSDSFGLSIALDGDRLAVGAVSDATGGTNRGAVHLFTGVGTDFSGLTWQKKLASGTGATGMPALADSNYFGWSVALDGDRLAVAAVTDGTAGFSRGAVHLFTGVGSDFSGLTWQKKLASGAGAIGMPILADVDWFGSSLALDGDRLAVGAVGDDTGGSGSGAVHLFTGVGTNFAGLTWQKKLSSGTGAIGMPTLGDSTQFGWSVALYGDRLAVGTANLTAPTNGDVVYLFSGIGADFSGIVWQKSLYSGVGAIGMPNVRFSTTALALDGERLVVGSSGDGSVHLFTGVGADFSGLIWQKKLASGTGAIGMPTFGNTDQFGRSVAIDGDRLAVGAPNDSTVGTNRGAMYLFSGLSTLGSKVDSPNGATFANNPDSTSYITPAIITSLLDAGTAVTLQANNDITVLSPVLSSSDMRSPFTLQAGRNINFQANVRTPYGDLTAVAGDPAATAQYRDPGVPTITIASGVTLNVLTGTATLAAIGGNIINNAGDSAISVINGFGRWLIYAADPATSTEGFSGYNKHYDQSYASGDTPGYAATGNWFLYSLAPVLSVTPSNDSITYGNTPGFDPGLAGFIDGDTANSAGIGGSATWTVAGATSSSGNPTAGSHDVVYCGGLASNLGYRFADNPASDQELTVYKRQVDVSGLVAANKTYDGTVNATVSGGNLSGAITGDNISLSGLTGEFDDKHVGTAKPVTLAFGFAGTDAANYSVCGEVCPVYMTTADITPKLLLLASYTGSNKTYDGTTVATVTPSLADILPGDVVSFSQTAAFRDKNAGTAKPIDVTGITLTGADGNNYALQSNTATTSADITQKLLLLASYTGSNKTYDGATVATVTPSLADILPGDVVSFNQTATFRDKNVGVAKPIDITGITLTGADGNNYALQSNTATSSADISTKALSVGLAGSATKTFDTTQSIALNSSNFAVQGLIPGDDVSIATPNRGTLGNADTGANKNVSATGIGIAGGNDAGNYSLASATAAAEIGTVTPATLVYRATPATMVFGMPVPALSGSVTGFLGNDSSATATNGSLAWATPATLNSSPGNYSITGQGLSASNYEFVQAPENSTALAVLAPVVPTDPCRGSVCNVVPPTQVGPQVPDPSGPGRIVDATLPTGAGQSSSASSAAFVPIDLSSMSRESILALLADRHERKKKIFADAIFKLTEDPSLAEVKSCPSDADVASGTCIMTADQREKLAGRDFPVTYTEHRKQSSVTLPQINRKLAVLIGINDYQDRRIPALENAIPDVESVAKLFEEKLGYETRVIRNPSKVDLIKTLNQLSAEIKSNDSVVLYYAGHGYMIEKTGVGYWLPADAPVDDPSLWISNNDVSKFLTNIHSNQLVMISDSCYSGAFTKEQKLAPSTGSSKPEEILTRRSVVVMSSGGDEPVADEGKEGHSIFAWNLMQVLKNVASWQPGSTIFEQVRTGVSKEFPQTPQYGAAISAGHQAGGDYLFEHRQIEPVTTEK